MPARDEPVPAGARRLRERSGGRQRGDEPEPAHLRRRRVLLAGAVLTRGAVQVNCPLIRFHDHCQGNKLTF